MSIWETCCLLPSCLKGTGNRTLDAAGVALRQAASSQRRAESRDCGRQRLELLLEDKNERRCS